MVNIYELVLFMKKNMPISTHWNKNKKKIRFLTMLNTLLFVDLPRQ
jgi:hypothetical protein